MCFGALGAVATAFIATLGPQTGLRTMIIARFSSGYVGGIIYSVLNILTQYVFSSHSTLPRPLPYTFPSAPHRLGFSTTAVILGGQTLASINPGTLPLVVGIIIVGVCSLIPCFVGYDMVHRYERYAWGVIFIVMLCLWGLAGHAGFDISAQRALEDKGKSLSADVLSFGGIVFGSFSGVRARSHFIRFKLSVCALRSDRICAHTVGPRGGGLQLQAPCGHLVHEDLHTHVLWAVPADMLL